MTATYHPLRTLGERIIGPAKMGEGAARIRADGEDDDVDLTVGARLLPKPQLLFTAGVLYCLQDIVDWGAYFSAGYEF